MKATPGAQRHGESVLAPLTTVALGKLAVSGSVLAAGFCAVSDDDYARSVIAQRFAGAPSLDPSGTSWLPLPFWVYGTAFAAFGTELVVARIVAVTLGIFAVIALFAAARWLGASRAAAALGASCASLFGWSAWLGAAPLPEAPCAALIVLGLAALSRKDGQTRLLGGIALAAACLCRYEAWPAAAYFGAACAWDAKQQRTPRPVVAGMIALLPIGAWLLHGVVRHADALFFWKRVKDYREALGYEPSVLDRVLSIPRAFVSEEPVLLGLTVLAFVLARPRAAYLRPLGGLLSLLAFLAAGELGGGGPTHHAARALLPVWFLAALWVGEAFARRAQGRSSVRALAWTAAPLLSLAAGFVIRGTVPRHFVDRRDAVAIGTAARQLGAPALLVDTPDFAYLAVIAAYGEPRAADPLHDRDPRRPRAAAKSSTAELQRKLRERPDAWLVASRAQVGRAAPAGEVHAENASFVLVRPRAR